MNNDDATFALTELLNLAIDHLPVKEFELPIDDARAILAAIPADMPSLADTLHDAFRDNIPDFTA